MIAHSVVQLVQCYQELLRHCKIDGGQLRIPSWRPNNILLDLDPRGVSLFIRVTRDLQTNLALLLEFR